MVVKRIITGLLGIVVLGALAFIVFGGNSEVEAVRAATEGLQTVEAAQAAGHVNVNVDGCVSGPDGAMGYHYVNFDLVDLELDPEKPEIMVFIPDGEGGMRLGAVEYAVPIDAWDANNDVPPTVLGQTLHPNPELGLYVLHAWIYEENPSGVYADWNPNVSCFG